MMSLIQTLTTIRVNDMPWRRSCGIVLQSDSTIRRIRPASTSSSHWE